MLADTEMTPDRRAAHVLICDHKISPGYDVITVAWMNVQAIKAHADDRSEIASYDNTIRYARNGFMLQ